MKTPVQQLAESVALTTALLRKQRAQISEEMETLKESVSEQLSERLLEVDQNLDRLDQATVQLQQLHESVSKSLDSFTNKQSHAVLVNEVEILRQFLAGIPTKLNCLEETLGNSISESSSVIFEKLAGDSEALEQKLTKIQSKIQKDLKKTQEVGKRIQRKNVKAHRESLRGVRATISGLHEQFKQELIQSDLRGSDAVAGLTEAVDKKIEGLSKTDEVFAQSIDDLSIAITNVSRDLTTNGKALQKEYSNLINELEGKLKQAASLLKTLIEKKADKVHYHSQYLEEPAVQRLIDKTDKKIARSLGALSKLIGRLESKNIKLKEELKTKSDIDHTHSQYALKEDTTKDLKDLRSEVSKKMDKGDLAKESQKVIDAVVKQIPDPIPGRPGKDGKDGKSIKGDKGDDGAPGKGWLLEFDKVQPGLLHYKREDDKEWKTENLRGPQGRPGKDGSGSGGGAAGVDIYDDGVLVATDATSIDFSGATVTKKDRYSVEVVVEGGGTGGDGNYYVNGVKQTNVKTIMLSTATDEFGEFVFDLTTYNLTEVFDLYIWAPMLGILAPPIERKVDAAVELFTPASVSGYCWVNRKIVRLVGGGGYALQIVPEGTTVHLKVIGK